MSDKLHHGMVLHQPWARLVAEGVFPVLVRPTPVRIRERVGIIARGVDPLAVVDGRPPPRELFPEPAFVGSVKIAGCLSVSVKSVLPELRRRFGDELAQFYPKHYIPDRPPVYFWLLKGPKLLPKPKEVGRGGPRVWVDMRHIAYQKRRKMSPKRTRR